MLIFSLVLIVGEGTLHEIIWGVYIPWAIFGIIIGVAGLIVAFLGDGK